MKIRDKIRAVEADAIRHAEAHGAYAASPVISLDFAHTLDEAAAHLERSVPASQLRALDGRRFVPELQEQDEGVKQNPIGSEQDSEKEEP